jgi:ParB family chromosome partitioning protein
MSVSSQTAQKAPGGAQALFDKGFIITETGAIRSGEERVYALNRLKASPDNVRKGGHSQAVIEARAASILAKGIIQPPVVKPERRADGSETGYALVTAGEGRRLALRLLAKRKLIPRGVLVRCLVDEANDAVEVSLDENLAREPLPAVDAFEAFHDLAERKGWGAETIAARYGVTAAVVRQRLRLAAVAPVLIARHRQGDLTLDQLMAFAVSEDHERQLQVFETYPQAHPSTIRRAMTEKTVQADDRRVRFIGVEAYVAAGGTIIRDLFSDDRGGYLSDIGLIDGLVSAKLSDMAENIRIAEGWKWAEWRLDYPHGHGLSRVWPKPVPVSAERQAKRDDYNALCETWGGVEDIPAEIDAQMSALEAVLEEPTEAYAPEDLARAGVWVILGYDGQPRVERGLVLPEDEAHPEPDPDENADEAGQAEGDAVAHGDVDEDEPDGDARAPLSAKLIADLTAHRTAGLRLALANDPDLALVALTHVLTLCTFHGVGRASCLTIQAASPFLHEHGEGVKTSPAYEAMETRFGQWAKQVPEDPAAVWPFVVGLDADSRASLLAFCVGRTVDAVKAFGGRGAALAHAEVLATATALDMTPFWRPTAERYLSRVTKAHVLAAVSEAVSPDTAQRLSGLKKGDLMAAAEPDLVKARWLPVLLRTRGLAKAQSVEEPAPVAATGGEEAQDAPNPAASATDLVAAE